MVNSYHNHKQKFKFSIQGPKVTKAVDKTFSKCAVSEQAVKMLLSSKIEQLVLNSLQ